MKRFFDISLSIFLILILIIPMLIIAIIVILDSKGPIIYWSSRIGKNNILFEMPKFRSMEQNTKVMATHLIENPENFMTSFGKFIRRTSLDELPQIYSVLKGDMSFVGPRPALFNQHDLIKLRAEKGVDELIPGITGWAQVNGRDELSIEKKVFFEVEYLNNHSFWLDLKILWLTVLKVLLGLGISH